MELVERLVGACVEEQREVLTGFVEVVQCFSGFDSHVVDVSVFLSMAELLRGGLVTGSSDVGKAVAATLEDLPFMKDEDEPQGLGWFVGGAVVELIYVAWYLEGRPRSLENAYTRMADLLDELDDNLGTSLQSLLVSGMQESLSGSGDQARRDRLVQDCNQAAYKLQCSWTT